jgi:hypothetical protein
LSEIEFGTLLELNSVISILGDFISAFICGDEAGWAFVASDILERLQGLESSNFEKGIEVERLNNSIRVGVKITRH